MANISDDILSKAKVWLNEPFDVDTRKQVMDLIKDNPKILEDSFYKDLEFGTGGMRGIMGTGTNRLNKYTIGKITQGVSNYLNAIFKNDAPKVAIAYDCRINSKEFAQIVAQIFSANNIRVFLFEDLRPTPELSFAVRHLGCQCGIVLTASHNPPEYNGYKVYWGDGAQLVPPHDYNVIQEISKVDYNKVNYNFKKELIEEIGEQLDKEFIKTAINYGSFNLKQADKDDVTIVFTSLHGTTITLIPETLIKAGYKNYYIVEEQANPDGNFSTVESPNPEDPNSLQLALELAEKVNADIVIGTDPDGDRLGIAVRNLNNELQLLNGNETMLVMTDFLLGQWQKQGKLMGKEFIATTIVSTPMMQKLADQYGVDCKVVLTGFRWIAKLIQENPNLNYVGGGEESFGYMVGNFVRDKDSVTSTLLAIEAVCHAKSQESSAYKRLLDLYVEHGFYKEHLISLTKKGKDGAEEIKSMMEKFRDNPLKQIGGEKINRIDDYSTSISQYPILGKEEVINLPKSNVLVYNTENFRVALRPSGTEPKIKFYISVNTKLKSIKKFDETSLLLDHKIREIEDDLKV